MSILENLKNIQAEASDARIIAVIKYVSAQGVIEAYQAGIRDFGENRVQDAEKRIKELPQEIKLNSVFHFIGHLQKNKIKKVVGKFDYIHSVDSQELLEEISEYAASQNILQKVLIQINIAREESKSGFFEEDLKRIFPELIKLDSISVEGLMTMAPFTSDERIQRQTFKQLRSLKMELAEKFKIPLKELSMGMSNDYKTAVEEGSTMLRIGQAIFL